MAALVVVVVATLRLGWNPGQVNAFFLFGIIAYFAVLERIIPYERSWHPDRQQWGWYGVYFVLTMIGGGLAMLVVMSLVGILAPAAPALPLGAEIPLALLVSSLASYLIHRLAHSHPWLWRVHGVHHVPQQVNVANNGVNHIFDIVLAQGLTQLSLALCGFSQESVFTTGLFIAAQGYFSHANIDVRIGWLNHLVSSPEQHRLHHSTDLSEAGHFGGDLSIWDRLFGSFTWYPGRRPLAIGLSDPASFPENSAVIASLLHPWRRLPDNTGRPPA